MTKRFRRTRKPKLSRRRSRRRSNSYTGGSLNPAAGPAGPAGADGAKTPLIEWDNSMVLVWLDKINLEGALRDCNASRKSRPKKPPLTKKNVMDTFKEMEVTGEQLSKVNQPSHILNLLRGRNLDNVKIRNIKTEFKSTAWVARCIMDSLETLRSEKSVNAAEAEEVVPSPPPFTGAIFATGNSGQIPKNIRKFCQDNNITSVYPGEPPEGVSPDSYVPSENELRIRSELVLQALQDETVVFCHSEGFARVMYAFHYMLKKAISCVWFVPGIPKKLILISPTFAFRNRSHSMGVLAEDLERNNIWVERGEMGIILDTLKQNGTKIYLYRLYGDDIQQSSMPKMEEKQKARLQQLKTIVDGGGKLDPETNLEYDNLVRIQAGILNKQVKMADLTIVNRVSDEVVYIPSLLHKIVPRVKRVQVDSVESSSRPAAAAACSAGGDPIVPPVEQFIQSIKTQLGIPL